jgi:RNA polymerase sigma factor (sigma-70 family)
MTTTTKWDFFNQIEGYRHDLMRYCCSITGSVWDAEDLVQETMLRAMLKTEAAQSNIPKAYLFRTASNAWIDYCRKQRLEIDSATDIDGLKIQDEADQDDVKEAIEMLVNHLPHRQQAVIFLMDVFQYTAAEVAEKMELSEGAVKALVHRARTKLTSLNQNKRGNSDPILISEEELEANVELVDVYFDAFNKRDPYAIFLQLHSDSAVNVVSMKQRSSHKLVRNRTKMLDCNKVFSFNLQAVKGMTAA